MDIDAKALELTERANKCCGRTDGYEEDMAEAIRATLNELQTEVERWKQLAKDAADAAFHWYDDARPYGLGQRDHLPEVKAVDDALAASPIAPR